MLLKKNLWLQGLLNEIGSKNEMVRIYADNQSAVHLSKNSIYHDETEHVDVKFNFVRKIPIEFNPSDFRTKELYKFKNCSKGCEFRISSCIVLYVY